MRMRHKKHLDERLERCKSVLLDREKEDFYSLNAQQRNFIADLKATFGNDNPVVLEIGCGKGNFAITCAKRFPQLNFVAVEKLSNVIVVACEQAIASKTENLRFLNCSAENLLCFLPQHSISEIVLNFSCPFPKKTYANRRLTHAAFLEKYKLLLTENGFIRQKTDDIDFFEFSLEQYRKSGFTVIDITYDLHSEQTENIVTEYESKFVQMGKKICACTARMERQC